MDKLIRIDDRAHKVLKTAAAKRGTTIKGMISSFADILAGRGKDPVIEAFMAAPDDDEPLTDRDRAAIARGEADIKAGRVKPWSGNG